MTVDNLSLAGKVAIVTGSGRENGIGAAIALALARNGAAVTINYVSETSGPRAQVVAEKIRAEGGKVTVVQAAVDQKGAKTLVDGTLKAFGTDHIDILVNNAGSGTYGGTLDHTKEQIEEAFNTNVFGTIFVTQAVVPHMPPGGRIINITSIAAKIGLALMPIYGASKAAVDSLTYTWAAEFGKSRGITVNSVAPGPVATDILPSDPAALDEATKPLLGFTRAANRIGTTADIADVTLLLVSEKARWVTGQHVSASGGITGQ